MEANLLFFVVFISLSLPCFLSQPQPQPALPPDAATCDGIFISYAYTVGYPIPPPESNPPDQPYRFESTLRVRNNGLDELKSWQVFVGFRNREILVSADGAVLADGTSLPARVGNGVVLAGMPKSDLKSAVETAGDLDQMEARVTLVGTQFGVGTPAVPMPANITLVNDGYSCPTGPATNQGNNEMHVCCSPDPSSRSNTTKDILFLPRQEGDLIIMYDVISSDKDENYLAQVTISNNNSLGRLENWRLTWDWMREEFIYSMRGAYPEVVDSSDCLFGRQGQHYKGMDFSKVLNCERRPKIMDLPPTRANDTEIGLIPFCCRNGKILPPRMDPSKSVSAFQMQVFKMPPDLNRTELNPPVNWNITGTSTMSPDHQCGQPVRVSPSHFIDARGLPSTRAAVASWQVVCNITQVRRNPRCCVSFSSFSNESAVPCNTCACGCSSKPSQTCSATTPSLIVPPDVLLKPFDNRTKQTKSWYNDIKHWELPDPLPCGDNCGVSINWHLLSDFRDGWSSRITVFNWGETAFADWFAAIELENAAPGFEAAYSLNATALNLSGSSNDTVFIHGLKDFNFLLPETESKKPKKDPPVPGTQQSVISFTKKKTPGIRVVKGDGFPTRVFFNGEECALPTRLPTNNASKHDTITTTFNFLALAALVIIIQLGLC